MAYLFDFAAFAVLDCVNNCTNHKKELPMEYMI